jgi:hypothetical protein
LPLGVEVAVPAVVLEYIHLLFWESLTIGDGHVALDVAHGAHAWDDGRDGGMAQEPTSETSRPVLPSVL